MIFNFKFSILDGARGHAFKKCNLSLRGMTVGNDVAIPESFSYILILKLSDILFEILHFFIFSGKKVNPFRMTGRFQIFEKC